MPIFERRRIPAMILAAAVFASAAIWIGLGHAGDDGTTKLPAISTIGPEINPYVLTTLEREKRLLPVTVSPASIDIANIGMATQPSIPSGPYQGMTSAELDKLERWTNEPRRPQRSAPETVEAFSTIENVPRAPGIEGLTPRERAKLEAYLETRNR
jgi:hypothetical protein